MNELKMEWILLKRRKWLFVFVLLPIVCSLLTYLSQYKTNNDIRVLHFDEAFMYFGNTMISSFYFISIAIIGAMWVNDELKNGLFLQIAVIQKNNWRFYVGKIISLFILLFVVLLFYSVIFINVSIVFNTTRISDFFELLSAKTLVSFFVYYFAFLFWGTVGLILTLVFRSASLATAIIALYILFEKLLLTLIGQYPLLAYVSYVLPWSQFQSVIFQVTKYPSSLYKAYDLITSEQPILFSILLLLTYFILLLMIGRRLMNKAVQ